MVFRAGCDSSVDKSGHVTGMATPQDKPVTLRMLSAEPSVPLSSILIPPATQSPLHVLVVISKSTEGSLPEDETTND